MTTKITTDNIASETLTTILGPKVSSIVYPGDDTAANTAGGDSITLLGSGFNNGASVIVNGTSAGVVTVVSSTQITFTAPAQTAGTYVIYVINSDGGTAISIPGISYSGTPTWSTTAGNIGVGYETGSISTTVTATGDDPITYSVVSGTLPTGSTLDTSTGLISGTASATASSTTYSFTIKASDAQNQDTNRAFTITVNPDVVTWSSPASNETYSVSKDIAIANVEMSATSASGGSITYTADTLPTGLSITGANIAGTPTVADSTSTTLTATSTSTRSATRTINWVVSIANDTYFKNTTLLLNGETTVTPFISDASTNNVGLNIAGDTRADRFSPYYGDGYYSTSFNGTTDYQSFATNSVFAIGTNDFTIELWVFPTTANQRWATLFAGVNYGSSSDWGLYAGDGTTALYPMFMFTSGSTPGSGTGSTQGSTSLTSYTPLVVSAWSHVAVSRVSGIAKMFINGVQVGVSVTATTWSLANTLPKAIGGGYNGNSNTLFTGNIYGLRIVSGTGLYANNFTPSTTPLTAITGTILLTCQYPQFVDKSATSLVLTNGGTPKVSPTSPLTNPNASTVATYGSAYFDGTGDYLSIPDNVAFTLGSNDFTFECWVYPTSITNGNNNILAQWGNGNAWIFRYVAAGRPQFSGAATNITGTTTAVTINQWNHVAITRTSGTVRLFVNGVLDATSGTIGALTDGASQVTIGAYSDGTSEYVTGYISNLRLINGTSLYTTTFTPPTTPLTAIANTSLLTLQYNGGATNKGIIDNSNFNNIITRVGNTSQGIFSPYSVTGWSSYMTSSTTVAPTTNAAFTWGTGNYTIEMWYNPSSSYAASNAYLFDQGSNQTRVQLYNNYVRFFYNNGATELTSTTAGLGLTIGTWYHLAIVRNSGVITMYINGTSCATVNSSANETSTSMNIGNYGAGGIGFNGYMSNFRAVKGTAVYTGNFTPSTSPLSPIIGTSILTLQSNRFVDNSPNSFTLTISGTPSVQAFGPFGSVPEAVPISYSNYFDGTGDYLQLPSNTAFNLGAGDFTIEMWVNLQTVTKQGQYFFYCTNFNPNMFLWDNGLIYLRTAETSGEIVTPTASGLIINTWSHVACVRSGNTYSIFVNGTLVVSGTSTGVTNTSSELYFGKNLQGHISNFRVVKGTAVYTSAFTPPTSPLTAISGTSLLTCQSQTMIDNSSNYFTITSNGNTKPTIFNPFGYTAQSATSYTPTTHGGSAYFDGTGDYLTIPYASYYDIPASTAFTFECWVYTSSTNTFIIANRNWSYGGSGPTWAFSLNSGITPQWSIAGTGSATYVMAVSSIGGTINAWNHYAFTRDGSNVVRIFVNGVLGASRTDSQAMTSASGLVYIGAPTNLAAYSTGYISDIRLNNGVAIYTSNFVPPTTSLTAITNTSLLLNFTNGGIIDQHGTNVLETLGNAQLSTAVKKYNNASMYFDGTGDYLYSPPNINYAMGSGDFTIEFWYYPVTSTNTDPTIMGNYNATWTTNKWALHAPHASYPTKYSFWVNNYGINAAMLVSTSNVTNGAWVHIAITRSGSTWNLFINGVSETNRTSSVALDGGTAASMDGLYVGANFYSGGGGRHINAYIDDLRITKGYARYTANFTPPTSAFITK